MLLENRVLWGAIASVGDPKVSLKTVIDGAKDVARTSIKRPSSDVHAALCALTTSVQYTQVLVAARDRTILAARPPDGRRGSMAAIRPAHWRSEEAAISL